MPEASSLRWRHIIGYGLGDVANNFVFAMGLLFLLNYYTDVAGICAAVAGTLLIVVRAYDAVMDLVVGRLIDQRRGNGRRQSVHALLPAIGPTPGRTAAGNAPAPSGLKAWREASKSVSGAPECV